MEILFKYIITFLSGYLIAVIYNIIRRSSNLEKKIEVLPYHCQRISSLERRISKIDPSLTISG